MAEAEHLVKVLDGLIAGQTRLGEMREAMHARAEANGLAITRMVETHGQMLAQALQSIAQVLQNVMQAEREMMQALERITNTTDRTERMTAEILARLASTQGVSH
jgi:hypothetical protein